jgi:hypothetical protein
VVVKQLIHYTAINSLHTQSVVLIYCHRMAELDGIVYQILKKLGNQCFITSYLRQIIPGDFDSGFFHQQVQGANGLINASVKGEFLFCHFPPARAGEQKKVVYECLCPQGSVGQKIQIFLGIFRQIIPQIHLQQTAEGRYFP